MSALLVLASVPALADKPPVDYDADGATLDLRAHDPGSPSDWSTPSTGDDGGADQSTGAEQPGGGGGGSGGGSATTPVGSNGGRQLVPLQWCLERALSDDLLALVGAACVLEAFVPPTTARGAGSAGGAGSAPAPPPNPAVLARSASDRLPLPSPRVGLSPSPDIEGLVGLQTWLWVNERQWRTLTESVTAGRTTVTVSARPIHTLWDLGEGTVMCPGPGQVWTLSATQGEESYCGYTYSHTSLGEPDGRYRVRATIRYEVTWRCTGFCLASSGVLEDWVESPTATVPYSVEERQTVVVTDPEYLAGS